MKSTQEVAAELREYLLTKVPTQRELAARLGISPTHMSNYLRGSERISRKVADRIVELWPEIREAFILTGDGPLLRGGVNINQANNTNTGDGAGAIHLGGDEALRQQVADLTARLERAEEEKARLLGIIETITGR